MVRGYVTIAYAKSKCKDNLIVDLIGVVVDWQAPSMTRGPDYMCTLDICDQSAALEDTKLRIRLFMAEHMLPKTIDLDDIVIIKHVRAKEYRGEPIVLSSGNTEWAVCKYDVPQRRNKKLPPPKPTIRVTQSWPKSESDDESPRDLTEKELESCKDLAEFWLARGGQAGARGVSEKAYESQPEMKIVRNGKFSLIKDVQIDHFYDLIGYVQDTWKENASFTVYITDFTENMEVSKSGIDVFGDPVAEYRNETYDYAFNTGGTSKSKQINNEWYNKRLARYTLAVVLWDSHARKGQVIKQGQYVFLINVRIKMSKGGQWEGAISDSRSDRIQKDGFEILKPEDSKLGKLKQRKTKLEEELRAVRQRSFAEAEKRKKEERERAEDERLRRLSELNPLIDVCFDEDFKFEKSNDDDEEANDIQITSISKIKSLVDGTGADFFNRRYHTECRIVDFRPHNIEDFCRPIGDDVSACSVDHSAIRYDEFGEIIPKPEWYWCFELDVVDLHDPVYLTFQVDDASARFLLEMEPCDLRAPENYSKRMELANKLFCLWGNLEETRRSRSERLALLGQHLQSLMKQFETTQDEKYIKKKVQEYEKEVLKITDVEQFMDPKVSNLPFTCYVKEYGIPDDEEEGRFHRMFALVYTKILKKKKEKEEKKEQKSNSDAEKENSAPPMAVD